jgi:acetyltransferase-like isoleucine patch superfamily enzyme
MIDFSRNKYRWLKRKIKFIYSVNWVKTYYFNYKKFPYSIARNLPVFFYGKVKFSSIKGSIIIDAPIKKAMIGFGQPYELISRAKSKGQLVLDGRLVFKGHVQLGINYFVLVANEAYCELGHLASLASNGKIICKEKIILGDYARIGSESQLIDTNFHQMINTTTLDKYPITAPIEIGDYNFVSNRVTIMRKTKTPNYCTIASNSLCNKDYSGFGENILIGGIPAKLLKENISRDWVGEQEQLEDNLIVK